MRHFRVRFATAFARAHERERKKSCLPVNNVAGGEREKAHSYFYTSLTDAITIVSVGLTVTICTAH